MSQVRNDKSNDDPTRLERLRAEVVCLADNLQALTYHPDESITAGVRHVDRTVELYTSFWHEPVEPFE